MRTKLLSCVSSITIICTFATAAIAGSHSDVADSVVSEQRGALAQATKDKGYGPQSPRNIDAIDGSNNRVFQAAPAYTKMNLCNIHFHENAEHQGGEFSTYAGNGNGKGAATGYKYNGTLSQEELKPLAAKVGEGKYGDLEPGDTIEVHFVHSTAKITPGPTLGSCLSESIQNPQLRVEALVMVLVNDAAALNFNDVAKIGITNGLHQAVNLPNNLGAPVQYAGSTTGPGYNEKGSPLQVSWSVRPKVAKVDINSIAAWLKSNVFEEDHAHGVRNLVLNPALLSPIN